MSVVDIWKVCVAVFDSRVLMHMGMGLHAVPVEVVAVLVVFVMAMGVTMLQFGMLMVVDMLLR